MGTIIERLRNVEIIQRAFRFVVVGFLSTLLNYAVFYALFRFIAWDYRVASASGYVVGLFFGFILNRNWTFVSKGKAIPESVKYLLVYLTSLFLSLSFLHLLVSSFSLDPRIANIFAIGFSTITNFLGSNYLVFRKFTSFKIPEVFQSPLFLSVLFLKLIASFLFGSDFLVKLFIPFVSYFVESSFANPYDFFYQIGQVKAFPYSGAMLYSLAIPRVLFDFVLSSDWQRVAPLNLFVSRIPILLSDLTIFIVLINWLRTKERLVTLFYWSSPILFYINYYHGQLDAIPTSLLFLSLSMIFAKRFFFGYFLFGLALSAKASMLAVLPFLAAYLYIDRKHWAPVMNLLSISFLTYVLFALPFLPSEGYRKLVLLAEEQSRVFLVSFPFHFENLFIILLPASYLLIFFRFSSYKKINKDALLMFLGMVFIILVALLPPMPGWFYWSVPILTYFFAKFPESPKLNFWVLNAAYLSYFLFRAESDLFQSWQIIAPHIASIPSPYMLIQSMGLNSDLLLSLIFTVLETSLLMTAFWIYKIAIKSNLEYKLIDQPTLIGIGGDSGAGKTTFANILKSLLGPSNTLLLSGDDIHKWERGDEHWQVFTHLNPKSNRLNVDLEQAVALRDGRTIERVTYNHKTGRLDNPQKIDPRTFIVFEGLHPLFLKRMRRMLDFRVFMEPFEDLRLHWKISRDVGERGHNKRQVLKTLKKRAGDAKKFVKPQKKYADMVISYSLRKPLRRKEILGESYADRMYLSVRLENSIVIDPLEQCFAQLKGLQVTHHYDEEMNYQFLEFSGSISSRAIENIAYQLIPNLEDLINYRPQWLSGYEGITQLIFVYSLSERLKEKEARWKGL